MHTRTLIVLQHHINYQVKRGGNCEKAANIRVTYCYLLQILYKNVVVYSKRHNNIHTTSMWIVQVKYNNIICGQFLNT